MVSTTVIHVITWIITVLIYWPRRHGRLSWPDWLTHSRHFTHEVVTCQPQISHRSGKVCQPKTDVLITEPHCLLEQNYVQVIKQCSRDASWFCALYRHCHYHSVRDPECTSVECWLQFDVKKTIVKVQDWTTSAEHFRSRVSADDEVLVAWRNLLGDFYQHLPLLLKLSHKALSVNNCRLCCRHGGKSRHVMQWFVMSRTYLSLKTRDVSFCAFSSCFSFFTLTFFSAISLE